MTGKFTCAKCSAALSAQDALCTRCLLETAMTTSELGPGFLDDLPIPGNATAFADKYRVLEQLGHGGMGVVFKARHDSLDRFVAIKSISAGAHANDAERDRFQREAQMVARLDHPAIVHIYDWGEDDGKPFFVMEYVEGRDLHKVLVDDGVFEAEPAARLVQVLAGAVQYAHDQNILHRDLKPANVLIDRHGKPKITDFGLAKRLEGGKSLTLSGQILGSVGYLPPEQVEGGGIGRWSDVYGLGAILYQVLTKHPPFEGESLPQILHRVISAVPVPPRRLNPVIPPALEAICLKCLEKDPKRRYATALELADELSRFLKGEPVQVRSSLLMPRLAWSGMTLLAFVLIAGLAVFWQQRDATITRPASKSPEVPTNGTLVAFKPLPNTNEPPPVAKLSPPATQIVASVAGPTNKPIISEDANPPATSTQGSVPAYGGAPQPQQPVQPLVANNLQPGSLPNTNRSPLTTPGWEPTNTFTFAPRVENFPEPQKPWTNSLRMVFLPLRNTAWLLAQCETRVQDFNAYRTAAHLRTNTPSFRQRADHPVVCVSFKEAEAFCRWLTAQERESGLLTSNQAYRLPLRSEWLIAALPTTIGADPLFPWGGQWPPPAGLGNLPRDATRRKAGTEPVGSFQTNDPGFVDLVGNVSEWLGDKRAGNSRLAIGGAWDSKAKQDFLLARPPEISEEKSRENLGFRCLLDTDTGKVP